MNYLGIKHSKIESIVKDLNVLLAEYQLYYQNLRNFHWNIEGENFYELHRVFEDLYNDAKVKIDEIAERILTLRNKPISKLTTYLKIASIREADSSATDREMVAEILHEHSILIGQMRKVLTEAGSVDDEGTIDLVAAMLSAIEKKSWMLDAWLAKSQSRSLSKAV